MSPNPANKIAFQGIHAAHSDQSCRIAHPGMETLPCPSFEDVIEAVRSGAAALGMIPIENSQAGRVAEIHNLLPQMNLAIVGERFHQVEHQLLAPRGATLEKVSIVCSQEQALLQCRGNLRALGVEIHPHSDTARAARDVAEWDDPTKAALASALAAEHYGLICLKPHMEDNPNNNTIFITIAKDPIDPDREAGRILTSLVFVARNIPAALFKALGGFATNQVNLLKLESYIPGTTREHAQFFVTLEGHPGDPAVRLALEELRFFCEKVLLLGAHPADPARFS